MDSPSAGSLIFGSYYAIPFWIVYFWVFLPEWGVVLRSRRMARQGRQDRGSLAAIGILTTAGQVAAFGCAAAAPGAAITRGHIPIFWAGLTLLLAGGLLRRHCFRMLGSSFTGAVSVQPGQAVVDRGAYRWVRHPGYSAGILIFTGVFLALANWLSLLVGLTPILVAYAYRIRVEEQALLTTLGEPYRDYMRRTRRLIPFVV